MGISHAPDLKKNMIHEDKISGQVIKKNTILNRGNFKTSPFAQYLRQAQILILEILNVWMPVPLYLSGVVKISAFLDLEQN